MSQMLKSSGAMGAATLASRVLGMVREMAYARFMGDGWVAGAFTLAFTIPNLFRRLLGEGAQGGAHGGSHSGAQGGARYHGGAILADGVTSAYHVCQTMLGWVVALTMALVMERRADYEMRVMAYRAWADGQTAIERRA